MQLIQLMTVVRPACQVSATGELPIRLRAHRVSVSSPGVHLAAGRCSVEGQSALRQIRRVIDCRRWFCPSSRTFTLPSIWNDDVLREVGPNRLVAGAARAHPRARQVLDRRDARRKVRRHLAMRPRGSDVRKNRHRPVGADDLGDLVVLMAASFASNAAAGGRRRG